MPPLSKTEDRVDHAENVSMHFFRSKGQKRCVNKCGKCLPRKIFMNILKNKQKKTLLGLDHPVEILGYADVCPSS